MNADPAPELPPLRPALVISTATGARWVEGRAAMLYRDLVPDRQGGRFVASHIRIPAAGSVPDYVHFHSVRFQIIYCARGWVRVVYEDQGPPFVLRAGDCVLQPPRIRHRVLESSAGLEVIEVACPAEHATAADGAMELPTATLDPARAFAGQRFHRHVAANATWQPWRGGAGVARDLGLGGASAGLVGAHVVRPRVLPATTHAAEFWFAFVLAGEATLHCEGQGAQRLTAGDACAVPAGLRHEFASCTGDLEALVVTAPADGAFAGA